MTTPKDEMFTTNEEDRRRLAARKRWLRNLTIWLFTAALLIAAAWFMSGCATNAPEDHISRELRARWTAKQVQDLHRAEVGIIWPSSARPEGR